MSSLLRTLFEIESWPLLQARNGSEALSLLLSKKPSIVVLDLGLPDQDGMEVLQRIRSFSNTPVLVLSARCLDSDKIAALDAGADDYVCKPFSVDELMARLRVIARRLNEKDGAPEEEAVFRNGDLTIDYARQEAAIAGEKIHLTPIEYRLLVLFSRNLGKVLTRTYIVREVWNSTWEPDLGSLRVYMTMLRKKLGHRYIETSFGVGYRMVEEDGIPAGS